MENCLSILCSVNLTKAKLIASRLELQGIGCYFKNFEPFLSPNELLVDVYVTNKDLNKANEILQIFLNEIPENKLEANETKFGDLIIVPVDFTKASENAVFFALELAAKFNVNVKLIHTYGMPEIRPISFDDTDFYAGTFNVHIAEMRNEAEKKMAELIIQVQEYKNKHQLKDITITTAIINGLPDEITVYTAESENASFIVMGISHKDVRTFEPIGKIASHVVEKSKCPVFIIPEDYNFVGVDNLKKILYTTAFDESDFVSIQQLLNIIRGLKSDIHLLHIGSEEKKPWDSIKMDGLRDYFLKAYTNSNVSCELVVSEDILNVLEGYVLEKNVDIIAMVTHKRNFIWKMINPSLTLKILYHTRIPLLVFHA